MKVNNLLFIFLSPVVYCSLFIDSIIPPPDVVWQEKVKGSIQSLPAGREGRSAVSVVRPLNTIF